MTDSAVEQIADQFSKTSVDTDGVSFKGKSLKLNSEKDCDEVVEAINSCQDLQYLNLEGNTLGVDASKAISKALESKSMLKRALWKDMFTGRMKEEIPRALEHLGNGLTLAGAQLTELDLSDNAFGPIGVEGLAGLLKSQACYQLQELKLNNNGLGISGGKMLAQALLQCHKNSLKEGKALSLKLLVVGRNRLENEGATALAEVFHALGSLEEISMPQNGIYHKGIKALSDSFKNNPNLRVLDLNDNTITEKGANHIAKALPHLQKLKVLNLGDCLLRTGGATVLAKALTERHGDLEELHLSFNEIRSEGGLAIAKAMTNKHNLKQLNVDGNQFGSAGRTQLREDLEKNKRILTLGTLSDDDSCDEESDNNEDGEEEDEGEGEVEEEEEEEEEEDEDEDEDEVEVEDDKYNEGKANGVSPVKGGSRISEPISSPSENKISAKDTSPDVLSSFLEELSIKAKPSGELKTFLEVPTLENFLRVKENQIYEFIVKNEDSPVDFYIDTFIPLLVKVSSFSMCVVASAQRISEDVSRRLYTALFAWAVQENQLSTVNNALFVHLDLIKSEDKNFKINWDVKGSLLALKEAIADGIVPSTTHDTLKFLMDKETRKHEYEEITVDN